MKMEKIEQKEKRNNEKNEIWNDKYPFEACAIERYPLRHVLLGVTF